MAFGYDRRQLEVSSVWGFFTMADGKVLKALKTAVQDMSALKAKDLLVRLRDPDLVKKIKKLGVNETQLHRIILILKEQEPDSKEFVAYLKSDLV
jgi:hypothetical protein